MASPLSQRFCKNRPSLPQPIYLQCAPKHADHQHGHREIVCEHIPPGLQHPERRLLLGELAKLGHGNHPPGKRARPELSLPQPALPVHMR